MSKDFIATVHDPERVAEWQQVYGSTSVCVRSFVPEWADLPGVGTSLVYMLDLNEITADVRQNLIAHISQKFNIPADQVAAELDVHGVPILAEGCTITIAHPQMWLLPDEIYFGDPPYEEKLRDYFDDDDEEFDDDEEEDW